MEVCQCLKTGKVEVVQKNSGSLLEFRKADEEQGKADYNLTQIMDFLVFLVQHHQKTESDERERNRGDIIRKSENRHNP